MESHEIRRSTADSFIRIAAWGGDPGLAPDIEGLGALTSAGVPEAKNAADAIIGVEGNGTVRLILQKSTPVKAPRE